MKVVNRKKKNDIERKVFWSFVGGLVFLFALYIFFVSSSVVHVVLREEVKKDTREANARVGQLEAQYIRLTQGIDKDLARRLGYVELYPNDKHFAEKGTFIGLVER